MPLSEKLTNPTNRERVIKECCNLIDAEVKSKGGLSGIAVKGAYGVVKAVKPTFVPRSWTACSTRGRAKLEPFYELVEKDGGGARSPASSTGGATPRPRRCSRSPMGARATPRTAA